MPAAALRRLAPSALLFLAAAHLAALAACGGPSASSQPPSASIAPPPARGDDDGDKRPYADMARTLGTVTSVPVRGRLVMEKGPLNLRASTPKREASQREIPGAEIDVVVLKKEGGDRLTLGRIRSDSEGYISAVFPLKEGTLEPGLHALEMRVRGRAVGRTAARLLDAGYGGVVVRSDIDLTYLDTHFTRKRDMLRLLLQSAPQRTTLPAMERVYAALRAGVSGKEDRPLVFISGSPRFFKRVLEARMDLDGVEQDGILLKPFDEIALSRVAMLDFDGIVPALKEQVGYKLVHMMNGRRELPPKTIEVLLGDDSESDFIVYSIYHRFTAGEIDVDGLDRELARAGLTAGQREPVKALASKLRAELPPARVVQAIYINRTGSPNPDHAVRDWVVPGVTRYHTGAWPLILDLVEEGLCSREAAAAVRRRLLDLGQGEKDLDAAGEDGVRSGFLRRETLSTR